jgi:ABC-type transport system involved in cytochrome c biogenesis permease subunit
MPFAFAVLQSQPDAQKMALVILGLMPILLAVGLAIIIVPSWFICKKAGFSPWLSLINLVPFGTLILLYIVAFAPWKVIPAPSVAQPLYPPPLPPSYPPAGTQV